MKKMSALLILGLLTLSMLFSQNYQRVYSVDDSIWDDISSLSLLSGLSLPSTTGPWSGEELKSMLDKIDTESLSGYARELYESIMSRIESDA